MWYEVRERESVYVNNVLIELGYFAATLFLFEFSYIFKRCLQQCATSVYIWCLVLALEAAFFYLVHFYTFNIFLAF